MCPGDSLFAGLPIRNSEGEYVCDGAPEAQVDGGQSFEYVQDCGIPSCNGDVDGAGNPCALNADGTNCMAVNDNGPTGNCNYVRSCGYFIRMAIYPKFQSAFPIPTLPTCTGSHPGCALVGQEECKSPPGVVPPHARCMVVDISGSDSVANRLACEGGYGYARLSYISHRSLHVAIPFKTALLKVWSVCCRSKDRPVLASCGRWCLRRASFLPSRRL